MTEVPRRGYLWRSGNRCAIPEEIGRSIILEKEWAYQIRMTIWLTSGPGTAAFYWMYNPLLSEMQRANDSQKAERERALAFEEGLEQRKGGEMGTHTAHRSKSGRFRNLIPTLLIAPMIPYMLTVSAATQQRPAPNFSGLWVEITPSPAAIAAGAKPLTGPPMRLTLSQHGSQVEVRLSYSPTSSGAVFGVATIQSYSAAWTGPESCGPMYRKPGYSYDKPAGSDAFTIGLMYPIDGGAPPGPQLSYTQTTTWNAPCDGHPIGTEQLTKVLKRIGP